MRRIVRWGVKLRLSTRSCPLTRNGKWRCCTSTRRGDETRSSLRSKSGEQVFAMPPRFPRPRIHVLVDAVVVAAFYGTCCFSFAYVVFNISALLVSCGSPHRVLDVWWCADLVYCHYFGFRDVIIFSCFRLAYLVTLAFNFPRFCRDF